ncbi:phosphatidate cytidylyltransferase [Qipengyuania sp. XHP0211]|uniref:phosphatidate cytidylyltransferase n=1 Tax=Qipengyuania sp. XHP0211 TaxID=3038079 RepID=UPI00241F623A|nr:phosphatidate cytidylyltransferase [Qipengyuania sp. XHP0211]MDG5749670.1 phosphatidate cytidylyltransferase [Qipengyuania sp. XHP0211]
MDGRAAQAVPAKGKNADLPVRAASALVMVAVAGLAFWLGGIWLDLFIAGVAFATLVEFVILVLKATQRQGARLAAVTAGAIYIGLAGYALTSFPLIVVIGVIGAVVFVDTFAYFFGRTIGGPKIAPAISPSKTWAGLLGGTVGASIWVFGLLHFIASVDGPEWSGRLLDWLQLGGIGAAIAVAAQAGDFLESWIKRKAGVKDSSNLIPGHGGVFDRTDGIVPVALLAAATFGAAL